MPKKKAKPVRALRQRQKAVASTPDEHAAIAGVPERVPRRQPDSIHYGDDYKILLRTSGQPVEIRGSAELRRMAMQWSYVLRNRARWHGSGEARSSVDEQVFRQLEGIGVGENELRSLAEKSVIEVAVPFRKDRGDDFCWEGRVMPWEYLLSAGTRPYRRERLVVVRNLVVEGGGARTPPPPEPKRLLFVQSEPGPLAGFYTFENECRLVEESLGITALPVLSSPSLEQLRKAVQEGPERPDVVHLAGFDMHQGMRLLNRSEKREIAERFDGYFLAGPNDTPVLCTSDQLAAGLAAGGSHRPRLVTCNFHHSAARTAALLVAEGAHAAIGFQDLVEDDVAERFLAHFYRAWKGLNWDIAAAFQTALEAALGGASRAGGTGVVLWSAAPLVGQAAVATKKQRRDLNAQYQREIEPKEADARRMLFVSATPNRAVNYALLHNGGELFKEFRIAKSVPGAARNIEVEVELHVGTDSFPCRFMLDLEGESCDVRDRIQVPLTSSLSRSLRESVHTSLFYRVSWGGKDVVSITDRVTLMPIDEWRFDDDYVWLPSFVLPRDRAVQQVLNDAQPYLMALKDDFGAGFDGYQSYDKRAEEPELGIHQQAQAIWCGLSYARSIGYINPPPSFAEYAQRIRTPGEVLENARGTCIDLALLLAACLEYVDIYPVIFLMEGHAFPGYWTSEECYKEYRRVGEASAAHPAPSTGTGRTPRRSWIIESDGHAGVLRWVDQGYLAPLETTYLTQHYSFQEALREGRKNVSHRSEFVSLIDIHEARTRLVTPLPVSEVRS